MLKHLKSLEQNPKEVAPTNPGRPLLELKDVEFTEIRLTLLPPVSTRRRGYNEALYNLKALARVILRPQSVRNSLEAQTLLESVTLALPPGISVGVLSTKPASRHALLDIASNALSPDAGTVRRHGRSASLGQTWAIASPFLSCRDNLSLLSRLLGAPKANYHRAMEAVERFDTKLQVLDLPLRRTPSWAFNDLALVMMAEMQFEILIAPEATAPTSEPIRQFWDQYLETVGERKQLILLGSRRAANLFSMSTHLILLDGANLVDFDTTERIRARHADLVEVALAAREDKTAKLPTFFDEEEETEEGEDDDPLADLLGPSERGEEEATRDRIAQPVWRDGSPRDIGYEDRESDLIEILRLKSGEYSGILLPDGSKAVPRPDDNLVRELVPEAAAALPVIYREEGGIVRLVLETKRENLWVYPTIHLWRRKTVLLRSSAPEFYVASPERIQFDVRLPPNFLQGRVFSVSAIIGVANRELGIEDVAIAKKLMLFANVSREDREWQPPQSSEVPQAFFRQEPQVEEKQIKEGRRYGIVSLALEDATGAAMHLDGRGYRSADAAERGFRVTFDVYVAIEPIKLVFATDLKWKSVICLRLAPVERVLAPGTHRITLVVPAGVLSHNAYQVCVGATGPDKIGTSVIRDSGSELSTTLNVTDTEGKRHRPWDSVAALEMKLDWSRHVVDGPAKTS